MAVPFQEEQLRMVIEISQLRSPFLDPLFYFLNYLDSPYFPIFLIPILWIGFSYRWGMRIFILFVLTSLVNGWLKVSFGWPRPCALVEGLGMFCFKSPGFPSGAAQTSFLLSGLLIYTFKTRAAWIVGGFYLLLMSFSRLYLGVHFPIDLLGGWAAGGAILFAYIQLHDKIEKFLAKKGLVFSCAVGVIPPILIYLLCDVHKIQFAMISAVLLVILACVSLRYRLFLPDAKSVGEALKRSLFAVAPIVLFLLVWPGEYIALKGALVGVWTGLAASPVYHFLR